MFDSLNLAHLSPEDEAIRPAIRDLIARMVTGRPASERVRTWMGADREFSEAMGREGFLGLTLPKKYGGAALGPFARFVVVEELLSAGAIVGLHWIGDRQSGPLILNYGTEAQRDYYLPRICKGEIFFCIGMSEPGSGSDLASVRTRAEKTSNGWRLNGSKIWTSNAHNCDYAITLLRTSGTSEDRHRGLSQLIVDLKAPGVTIRPIIDINGDHDFNEVFFDNVDLPADALLGEEGAGWEQVTAELAFERSGPERIYSSMVLFDAWIKHLRTQPEIGEMRQTFVGTVTAQLSALRAFSLSVTARLAAGEQPVVEASLTKDYGTGFEQMIPQMIADDLASHPGEEFDPDLRKALTHMLHISPAFSLRGGTREVVRGIIARGLGLR